MNRPVVLLLALSLVGCRERTPSRPAPTSTPAAARAASPVPTAADATPIPRAKVDALLAAWLAAQNEGRFDAYEALYAERFDGTKRTVTRARRYDRAGWIEDRRRMFQRPMRVEISDVEVSATPSVATVRFTQRWSSGAYGDEGPKQLVLVPRGDALAIASEQMLASRSLSDVDAAIAAGVLVVHPTNVGALVVLGPADEHMGTGPLREARGVDEARVALRAASDAVPASARSLVHATVQLVSAEGVCPAEITSLAIAAFVVPHFGTVQTWEDEDFDETTPPRPWPAEQVVAELDRMAEQRWLVGVAPSTCGEPYAAVRADRAPEVLTRTRASAPVVDEVLRALRRPGAAYDALVDTLAAGLAYASESSAEVAPTDAEVDAALARWLEVTSFASTMAERVVMARLAVPGECGGHIEVFVFERVGGRLVRRTVGQEIAVVFDAEGDGVLELAGSGPFRTSRMVERLGLDRPVSVVDVTYLDCGC